MRLFWHPFNPREHNVPQGTNQLCDTHYTILGSRYSGNIHTVPTNCTNCTNCTNQPTLYRIHHFQSSGVGTAATYTLYHTNQLYKLYQPTIYTMYQPTMYHNVPTNQHYTPLPILGSRYGGVRGRRRRVNSVCI